MSFQSSLFKIPPIHDTLNEDTLGIELKTKIINLFLELRTNYWLLPSLMALGAFFLAILMLKLDSGFHGTFPEKISWMTEMGAEGVRQVLALIATSMITIAGVVFSITIVALALASQQFGPRLLQNFMRDHGNQFVLGAFTATFLYCVMILPGVLGSDGSRLIPYYAAMVGILLGIGSLAVFIYFIHHISASIQANHVTGLVQKELYANIRKFLPEKPAKAEVFHPIPPPFQPEEHFFSNALPVRMIQSGYIRTFDIDGLVECARKNQIFIRSVKKVGSFAVRDEVLAWVYGVAKLSDPIKKTIARSVVTGISRTPAQDLEFSINELVEVALRALSSGINDPKTAIQCLDCLSECFVEIAGRGQVPFLHQDSAGEVRLYSKPVLFKDFVEAAFNEIRQASVRSVAVMIRLLENFELISRFAWREEDRQVLRKHGEMVYTLAHRSIHEKYDLEEIDDRYRRLAQTCVGS